MSLQSTYLTGRDRFYTNLPDSLAIADDHVTGRLVAEYGAVLLARGGAVPPDRVIYRDEGEVAAFQSTLETARGTIGEFEMELQAAAMNDLLRAVAEAGAEGLSITPRGPDSARRSYNETVELWLSRVEPALKYWESEGRLTHWESERISLMPTAEQVAAVLELEEAGIFFAKDLSKSILYSVAPPGTSQHLSLLAFDVKEFGDPRVRAILSSRKWYQTVVSDLPHFTYLGVAEDELPELGLKRVASGDQVFWLPDIPSAGGTK